MCLFFPLGPFPQFPESPNVQHLLKNGQKSDSFAAHFEHYFKFVMSLTDLPKLMLYKSLKQINQIKAIKL